MEKITLTDEHVFEVVFKHPNEEEYKSLFYDIDDFMNKTLCNFHEDLDESDECQSASCHNEDFNSCGCGSVYEGYEFFKLKISIQWKTERI